MNELKILEELETVKNMDDIREKFEIEYTFNTYNYHKLFWECPDVKRYNEGKHIFSQVFFGIYKNAYSDSNKLVLIIGRTGNTHAYIIKGLKE